MHSSAGFGEPLKALLKFGLNLTAAEFVFAKVDKDEMGIPLEFEWIKLDRKRLRLCNYVMFELIYIEMGQGLNPWLIDRNIPKDSLVILVLCCFLLYNECSKVFNVQRKWFNGRFLANSSS